MTYSSKRVKGPVRRLGSVGCRMLYPTPLLLLLLLPLVRANQENQKPRQESLTKWKQRLDQSTQQYRHQMEYQTTFKVPKKKFWPKKKLSELEVEPERRIFFTKKKPNNHHHDDYKTFDKDYDQYFHHFMDYEYGDDQGDHSFVDDVDHGNPVGELFHNLMNMIF